jgi:cytochrome c553
MLRSLLICGLSALALCLPGCSIFDKKPAADTLAAAAETAYYSCDGCHGPKHIRVDFMSPKIIGQKQAYLAAKLRDFRDLKRVNPYMNGVVAELTNQDIDHLAAYYANYRQGKK